MTQWRPITLLSSVYKILAKLISSRLRPFLPDLIHTSQTGFVQDRCILISSRLRPFLPDLIQTSQTCFVQDPWIKGVSALYRSTSSSVTIGGHVGCRFQLSRSVRQGCPLAPYLFLFVEEAMSDFIRVHQPALRGLLMPVSDEPNLIDHEYADDTLLFLHCTPDVLDTIRYALEMFCVASGACINYDKSYGILASSQDVPTWGQDVPTWGPTDFRWLRPGETCRYLVFQVGLDVSPEQQFSLVMQSMRRKLCYWSTRHLSMAGRVLVANQVLLTSAWYVASCWTMHGGVMLQLRRLIRNFLFGGSDGSFDTRPRGRWSTFILPTSQGGLGIIDLEIRRHALLTKVIVRGLFPGNEPWTMLLQSALATVTPTYGLRDGHSWTPGMRVLFTDAPLRRDRVSLGFEWMNETMGQRVTYILLQGKYILIAEKLPKYVVPDLTGFPLKPYVERSTPKVAASSSSS
ncbi:hypothetical protein L7F22_037019 [Adiantum nelumboides]|nr:hypothetical protein [Adiantum nelumboides]